MRIPPLPLCALPSQSCSLTEQPFKIPYYAALLRLLHDRPAPEGAASSFGRQVLEDLWKGFAAFVDKQAWREMRLFVRASFSFFPFPFPCLLQVHFFAHLTAAQVVSVQSMYDLLERFTNILDELGVSHGRASKAGLCAAEGPIIVG